MALRRANHTHTIEEYLALDEQSPERLEYEDGEIFTMAGEARQHSYGLSNLVAARWGQTRDKGCGLLHQNIKLMISSGLKRKGIVRSAERGRYYYPRLLIACGPGPRDPRIETDPCVLAEALSPSTAHRDKGSSQIYAGLKVKVVSDG